MQETWAPGSRAASHLLSGKRLLSPWAGLKSEMGQGAPRGPILYSSPNAVWLVRGPPAQRSWASPSGPGLWGVLGGTHDQVTAPPSKSGVTGAPGVVGWGSP